MEFRIVSLLMGTSLFQTPRESYTDQTTDQTTDSSTSPADTSYNPLYDSYNTPYDPSDYTSWSGGFISITSVLLLIAELVFYVVLGSLGAWLSWTSNSSVGWHPLFRVIFSIFAFIFSVTYVLSHIVFKLDLLSALRLARGISQSVASNASSALQRSKALSQAVPSLPVSVPQSQVKTA